MNPYDEFFPKDHYSSVEAYDRHHERDAAERDKPIFAHLPRVVPVPEGLIVPEPRWTADGKTRINGPLVRLGGEHQVLSAANCGNLPICWACGAAIQRDQQFHSVRTWYLEPQPSGDIVRDYVHGGNHSGPYATLCDRCCPACKDGVPPAAEVSDVCPF
jgi:hypothetical protein